MRKLKKPYSQNWRGLSAKWLFILSTVLGIIAGTCFWIFISRCGNEECFLNYDPLPEMFIGGVIGAFLYVQKITLFNKLPLDILSIDVYRIEYIVIGISMR